MVLGNLGCSTHGAAMVYPAKDSTQADVANGGAGKVHGPLRRADNVHR